ncbi:MoaD/ThiS family protein [Mumia flava]|uniref:MoaD/ThiS family protein n=1 Tax=Mumia flava TaxID=1348852 RepID=UPI001B80A5BE|nr:MoaD/ThiS family protein [Mumia flava]
MDHVEAGSVAQVLGAVRALHSGNDRFTRVLEICSVLVGEQPVGGADPETVDVPPGATVELLPPFAGGDGRHSSEVSGAAGSQVRPDVLSVGGSGSAVPR